MDSRNDTIFALSSGRPPAAIAIVRLSGPNAGRALRLLSGRQPLPRRADFATLKSADGSAIDEAVVLWFPGPGSATGEDVVELHVHGSRAVLAALFRELGAMPDLRPAEPGEFSRRAFENGKLDLTEAEGLDDLIHADTDMQRRQALRQLKGLLGARAETWRQRIIEASALIEAGIDFSDEGDVPDELLAPALAKVESLRIEIEETLAASARSERLREGLVVAIAGPPNVGKSTLLNRLARREAAIVSPHAGTTRDAIEVHLDLDGYPVMLIDTAGIRETDDPVEMEGVRRAQQRAASADLVLWLNDASDADNVDETRPELDAPVWIVRNKIDLVEQGPSRNFADPAERVLWISAAQGEGMDLLSEAVTGFARDYFAVGESGLVTRARQRRLLEEAVEALTRAVDVSGRSEEIVAEELRRAVHSLGKLLGRVDVDDILDKIFLEFCIGK